MMTGGGAGGVDMSRNCPDSLEDAIDHLTKITQELSTMEENIFPSG